MKPLQEPRISWFGLGEHGFSANGLRMFAARRSRFTEYRNGLIPLQKFARETLVLRLNLGSDIGDCHWLTTTHLNRHNDFTGSLEVRNNLIWDFGQFNFFIRYLVWLRQIWGFHCKLDAKIWIWRNNYASKLKNETKLLGKGRQLESLNVLFSYYFIIFSYFFFPF